MATKLTSILFLFFWGVTAQNTCNNSTLNTTVSTWPVTSTDTIYSISTSTNRSICDIARANRMSDATLMVAGETLLIPGETCDDNQGDTSCLISNSTYYRTCVPGGLHTYNTRYNDTRASIALKFEVSLDTITLMDKSANSTAGIIPTDSQLKIPQCSPSQCTVQPYKFTYGTYVDLAIQFNTTVGQIMAFNPTYNYSGEADASEGPVISMPMNCVNLTGNVTVIA
ncbi:hypothetical protein P280DRAFT_474783 [Massarina eburnea CBS 473.64]|uniref:LysM domain-containing protein n=1 Tax=Massarina eburnea CBS 473.64 TaxID=1395130 RepID=A0A6A6RGB1_9PLEO|nr:hypothetical protein P280DRAFT_474783 [Massarina eburnea CBS 473.64]